MYLRLVCHHMLLAIFILAPASSAMETYDDLYVGCYKDDATKRVLPNGRLISNNMTIELCIDYCTTLTDTDSAYAGVEHANECYCGVAGTNYSRHGVAEDGDCVFPCAGDSTTICGGASRISIFNLLLIRAPTTPAASTPFERDESTIPLSTNSEKSDELYVGCFRDAVTDRVLPDALFISDAMTIQLCIDYCTELNDIDSAYAGVEFGYECYCGVAGTNYSRLGVAEDGDCNFPCAGDDTTICGSKRRISIYNLLFIRAPTTTQTSAASTHTAKSEAVTTTSSSISTGSTTNYYMSTGSILGNTGKGSSLVPTLIYTLVPLFVIAIFVVLLVCFLRRRKGLNNGSSRGIAASGEPRESPGIKDNPTFESSNVHDLRSSDVAGCHGGNDPYMALTTPHDGPTVQVYEPLREVNSKGDGYEVPINGTNGQTGPESQEHPDTDYEITHEYQDLTTSVVGRNNSIGNESPVRGLQVKPETDYEAIHDYENPGISG